MNELKTTEPDPLGAAFDAGLRAAEPCEPIEGLIARHKEQVLENHWQLSLAQLKRDTPGPSQPSGRIDCLTPESLARAIADHSNPRTAVFADVRELLFRAVFDHVRPVESEGPGTPAGWGQWEARMQLEKSRKLREWCSLSTWTGQVAFADFLEDHLEDSIEPTGQTLLEIATDLEASESGSFKGRVNMSNGNVALHYQTDTETSVEIPRELVLGIPLFEHGELYRLRARLRFQVGGGEVKFRVLFTNLQDAIEQDFERIVTELEEKIGRPIFRGNTSLPY